MSEPTPPQNEWEVRDLEYAREALSPHAPAAVDFQTTLFGVPIDRFSRDELMAAVNMLGKHQFDAATERLRRDEKMAELDRLCESPRPRGLFARLFA